MSARLPVVFIALWSIGACSDDNGAPSLALVLDQQVVVGDTMRLVLSADDPDGDRLDFSVSGLPDAAQVTPRAANEAVLVWSPLITDTQPGGHRYEAEVTVDDGRGGTARQSFGVVVYPTFGVPAFTLPAGVVVNLGQEDDLELLVEVKDDDSTDVTIELTEAPAGAKLQRADKKVAHFFWRPDKDQRTVAVHRAIFSARDESHPPVTHVLTIVLLNAEKQSGCEGQPPTVTHTPPGDRSVNGPIELYTTAVDAQSGVQAVTLHWTRGDPNGAYAAAAFSRLSDDAPDWRVALDTGTLGQIPGSGALLYYYLEATDNDDPTGVSCDQTTRFPKAGFFALGLYPAGTPTSVCVDDLAEPDDDTSQARPIKPGTYAGRRLCGSDVDLIGVDAPPGTSVVAALTWNPADGTPSLALVDGAQAQLAQAQLTEPGRLALTYDRGGDQPIWLRVSGTAGMRASYTLELTVEATRCQDDPAEPDSTPGQARPLGLGVEVQQKICSGDSDFFRISTAAGQRLHFAAAFDHRYGDLDLELRAADGVTVLATAASEKSLEELDWRAGGNDLVLRVYGVEGATNTYALIAEEASGAECEPDGLGQNQSPDQAITLYQGVYENFHACDGSPDWFAVDLNGGETMNVAVLADGTGRVELSAYRDPFAAPIATGAPDSDGFALVSAMAQGPERLYYRASSLGGAVTYDLLQEVVDPPGACQPDRREPNGSGQPVPLTEGVHTWLRLCGSGDIDAFSIDVPAFTDLTVFTVHETGDAYIDLEVYGPTGALLYQATDLSDGAYLEEIIEQAGTYTLLVLPFDVPASGLGYDLALFLD